MNTTSFFWAKVGSRLVDLAPIPLKAEAQLSFAQPGHHACYLEVARPTCWTNYLFSSGSDPHSTLLGFCSIHFNSIQDALQHAKRLGWAHWPPRHAHRPPTPRHPGLGHSTHGARLSTWSFAPCPVPQGGVGSEGGQRVAGSSAGGKAGSVRWVLGWGSSFRVLSCLEVPAERGERQG